MKTNCYVYVCRNRHGHLKIGCSNNPEQRVKKLGRNMMLLYRTEELQHAQRVEYLAHRVMALQAKHAWGEWFEGTLEEAKASIQCAIRQADGQELVLVGRLKRIPPFYMRRRGAVSGIEDVRRLIVNDLTENYSDLVVKPYRFVRNVDAPRFRYERPAKAEKAGN